VRIRKKHKSDTEAGEKGSFEDERGATTGRKRAENRRSETTTKQGQYYEFRVNVSPPESAKNDPRGSYQPGIGRQLDLVNVIRDERGERSESRRSRTPSRCRTRAGEGGGEDKRRKDGGILVRGTAIGKSLVGGDLKSRPTICPWTTPLVLKTVGAGPSIDRGAGLRQKGGNRPKRRYVYGPGPDSPERRSHAQAVRRRPWGGGEGCGAQSEPRKTGEKSTPTKKSPEKGGVRNFQTLLERNSQFGEKGDRERGDKKSWRSPRDVMQKGGGEELPGALFCQGLGEKSRKEQNLGH